MGRSSSLDLDFSLVRRIYEVGKRWRWPLKLASVYMYLIYSYI